MIKINFYGDGVICFYKENGKLHRANDLPAIEYAHGSKYYYENGKPHRANGLPASEYADGRKYYYINGEEYYPIIKE